MIVLAFLDPKAAAAGWLIGFAFWSQILVGSLTLIMIHRLDRRTLGTAAGAVD